jgi:hypothetical protein
VTVDIGIDRRFDESPQAFAGLDLSADQVINTRRLQVYVRHVALTEPIREMTVGNDEIDVRMSGQAKLIGFIPVGVTYQVAAELSSDGGLASVTSEITSGSWWRWMATKQSSETISTKIRERVAEGSYLSTTQLRASVLEAIVSAVGRD